MQKQTSLQDLGLDSPIEKPFGAALDKFEIQESRTVVRSLPPKRKPNYPAMIAAGVVLIAVGSACLFVVQAAKEVPAAPAFVATKPAGEVMKELLAAINADSQVEVFGKSKLDGRTATIYLESGYNQLSTSQQREKLETVHNIWVNGAFGKRSIFKKWDGKVVASLGE